MSVVPKFWNLTSKSNIQPQRISMKPCLLAYKLWKDPLQLSCCILGSKINHDTFVIAVYLKNRSAITCLFVFNLDIRLGYIFCWGRLPCTNISHTLFSSLTALPTAATTSLLLFNLEKNEKQLTSCLQRSRKAVRFNLLQF